MNLRSCRTLLFVGVAGLSACPDARPQTTPALAADSPPRARSDAVGDSAQSPLIERVLKPATVLGTTLRGHLFIDGLPLRSDSEEFGRNLELRRARVSFERNVLHGWSVRGSVELVSGRAELKDFYVRRTFERMGTFTIGNHTEPFGMDRITSPLTQPFLERSLPTALAPDRTFGVSLSQRAGPWLLQGGLFGSGTRQEGLRDLGSALTLRAVGRWETSDGDLLHAGLAYSHRRTDVDALRFKTVPEIGLGTPILVDTGRIEGARDVDKLGLEFARTFGRTAVQAEPIAVRVTRSDASALSFQGASVQASWCVFGTPALYDDAAGVFTRAPVDAPAHWNDAWRRGNLILSARLSRIDLTDGNVRGGTETNLTLGATWDLNSHTRFAANAVHLLELTGPERAAEGSTSLAIRFQYAW